MEARDDCFRLVDETLPRTLSESTRKTYTSVLVNYYLRYGDGSGCIAFFTTQAFIQTLPTLPNCNLGHVTIVAAALALTRNAKKIN